MKCHVCGVDIPEGATHCPDCGTIIEVTEQGGLQRLVWGRSKHRPRACFHLQHRHRWWYVKDLGSSNGTFLWTSGAQQPQRLPPHQPAALNDGDEVAFGNARFIFRTR